MLYCADCGAKLYQVRAREWTHEQEHFVCTTYRKKGQCTSHQIHNIQVEEILLHELRKVPGIRTKKQTIAIIWNSIGAVDIPDEVRKTA